MINCLVIDTCVNCDLTVNEKGKQRGRKMQRKEEEQIAQGLRAYQRRSLLDLQTCQSFGTRRHALEISP